MDDLLLFLIIGIAVALGGALYFYMEHQARILRTRVVNLAAGGMRFEAHQFSFEAQRDTDKVRLIASAAHMTRTPLEGGDAQELNGPVDVVVPAAGLKIELTPGRGLCSITVRASDALTHTAQKLPGGHTTVLTIDNVPMLTARQFTLFAGRVRVWVERVEARVERDRIENIRKAEEAAHTAEMDQLMAQALAGKPPDAVLTESEREAVAAKQIAKWRQAAGFTGEASEVSIDAQGRVVWFIDLAKDGRITLHADNRTIHTTLLGASITSSSGVLEIGVRDAYWSEENPSMRVFTIFKGLPSDQRRAWKERLDLLRNNLERSHAL